jgi:hypothetical protein
LRTDKNSRLRDGGGCAVYVMLGAKVTILKNSIAAAQMGLGRAAEISCFLQLSSI